MGLAAQVAIGARQNNQQVNLRNRLNTMDCAFNEKQNAVQELS